MGHQLVAKARARETIPRDQGTVEPLARSILDIVVVRIAEAEGVRPDAVLVIDHFRVRPVPADIACCFHFVVPVGRRRYVLGYAVLRPDDDVFPIIAVAQVKW